MHAVRATERKKLLIAALWTEVCLLFPALDALHEGYEVYPVIDAVGGTSKEAHELAVERLIQAGARPASWAQVICELQRDWNRRATVPGFSEILHSVGGAILIHALAEQPPRPRLGGIFLIATPFIGEGGWPSDDIRPRTDLSEHLPVGVPIFLYHGAQDEIVPIVHVHLYGKAIPHAVVRTSERDNHQLNNDMSQVARDIRSLTSMPR